MKTLLNASFVIIATLLLIGCQEAAKDSDKKMGLLISDKGVTKLVAVDKLDANGSSYCCTFSNGTKCYSSNCKMCNCEGNSAKENVGVQISPKGVATLVENSKLDANGSSYCCTFSNGIKCYSSDCKMCNCDGN